MSDTGLAWAPIPRSVLDIEGCLTSGQAFLWRRDAANRWTFAIGTILVVVEPHAEGFYWATSPPGQWDVIADYFALDVPLEDLYSDWCSRLPQFAPLVEAARGLRILRQPAEAALIEFMCSSCNNVKRIAGMLYRMAEATGSFEPSPWGDPCPRLPSLHTISALPEEVLRGLGFGYRARFFCDMPRDVTQMLHDIADQPYEEARRVLMTLPGVGPKVADCVCLFGLRHDEAVPVDTHVRRYAIENLSPAAGAKSLTARAYDAIASCFRGIMGPYAGWAQQYVYVWQRRHRQVAGIAR